VAVAVRLVAENKPDKFKDYLWRASCVSLFVLCLSPKIWTSGYSRLLRQKQMCCSHTMWLLTFISRLNPAQSIEAGADALLIDEDTASNNFMVRDSKMVQLVAAKKEPITPFVRLVRKLYEEIGLPSIIVVGGSGDFFDVADHVLVMDCYKCADATDRAKQIAVDNESAKRASEEQQHSYTPGVFQKIRAAGHRFPIGEAYNADGKVKVMSRSVVSFGDTELNIGGLEQVVSRSQTNAISAALQKVASLASNGNTSLNAVLVQLEEAMIREGFDALTPGQLNGGLAKPRLLEIAGAINRLRREGSIVQR
jgi:predicted ABC-class ATPase